MRARPAIVDFHEFPDSQALFLDYVYDFSRVASFFVDDPGDPEAPRRAAARLAGRSGRRDALARELIRQLEQMGAPPEAVANAAALADPATLAVVTGQQVGLFGGPLYSLLKAITSIQLAARWTRELGVRVVPVFWMDADDHDYEEVRHYRFVDRDHQVRDVALPPRTTLTGAPVARVVLDGAVEAALGELRAALPETRFTAEVFAALARAYRPERALATAYGCWMSRLLGARGLVLVNPSEAALKALMAPVFGRELSDPCGSAPVVLATDEALRAGHYHEQVTVHPDHANLFYGSDERRPVLCRNGAFQAGDEVIVAAALQARLAERPEHFSPNVLLRPIAQDTVFPTLAYVAGPHELAYFAQLRGLYDRFDVVMPLIWPRASATLLEAAATRTLERLQLRLADLRPADESALNRAVAALLPHDLEAQFEQVEAALATGVNGLEQALARFDPTLVGAAGSARGKIVHEVQTLRVKALAALKRRDETLRRQFWHARAALMPDGGLQERTVGAVQFLNKHGWIVIDHLLAHLSPEARGHQLIRLDAEDDQERA